MTIATTHTQARYGLDKELEKQKHDALRERMIKLRETYGTRRGWVNEFVKIHEYYNDAQGVRKIENTFYGVSLTYHECELVENFFKSTYEPII
jgi:hypothetical protein